MQQSNKRSKKGELPFEPKEMVDWFSPSELASTGLRSVISKLFGNYADKRELQAALAQNQSDLTPFDFSDREELWIDYASDLGSGWQSTYSVAYLLGRKELTLTDPDENRYNCKRGNILVMGGDEVYPIATPKEYQNRLVGPYKTSLPEVQPSETPPTLFAIPGNHDWYDGLSSFIKLFCQQRNIGAWQTRQTRSYFAAKLPHNWWLWGIDIQLSADIDKPQIDYFDAMHEQASEGDRIILCTAEPAWVYQEHQADEKPYENLRFFINRYSQKADKEVDFRVTLTGDMHHYTSFKNIDRDEPDWKITAGGGGAFTHPTHHVSDRLKLDDGQYEMSAAYPDKKESRRMAFKNLKFPFINKSFGVFFAIIYLLFGWFAGTSGAGRMFEDRSFFSVLAEHGFADYFSAMYDFMLLLVSSPGLMLYLAILFTGMYLFADTKRKKPLGAIGAGVIHGLIQLILLLTAVWFTAYLVIEIWEFSIYSSGGIFWSGIVLGGCGWIFSGLAMGIYLMCTNLMLNLHATEAFSSFRDEDHKNFVRLHLTEDGLTVYPVKIPKACRRWITSGDKSKKHDPILEPDQSAKLKYSLIEEPFIIH